MGNLEKKEQIEIGIAEKELPCFVFRMDGKRVHRKNVCERGKESMKSLKN